MPNGQSIVSENDLRKRFAACEFCDQRVGDRCKLLGRELAKQQRDPAVACPLEKWPAIPLQKLITIGITSYLRPDSLRRLQESIARYYGDLPVRVVDTQGNLSWGRNQLVEDLATPFLLLCEDDFEFTEETRIELLLDVLLQDAQIGAAGGELIEADGRVQYAQDFELFNGRLNSHATSRAVRVTPGGIVYQPCELIMNFGLFRRELLQQVRWNEDLHLDEHHEWYWRVRQAGLWRMALVKHVAVLHHKARPSNEYNVQRARQFRHIAEAQVGAEMRGKASFVWPTFDRPNVVVLGVGHSGTSIVTRQLFALGWNAADADERFAESVSVRRINEEAVRSGALNFDRARRTLGELPAPWAVKDPRFVETLHQWLALFAMQDQPPLLLWITRDLETVRASYRRRGEFIRGREGVRGRSVAELFELASKQFERYPWPKLRLDVENIAKAVELFSVDRLHQSSVFG